MNEGVAGKSNSRSASNIRLFFGSTGDCSSMLARYLTKVGVELGKWFLIMSMLPTEITPWRIHFLCLKEAAPVARQLIKLKDQN